MFTGPHPETGEPLEVVDHAPEGFPMHDLPSQPAVFAPDYAPEEIEEIAQKLRKKAGLPDEPIGEYAKDTNGGGLVDEVKDKVGQTRSRLAAPAPPHPRGHGARSVGLLRGRVSIGGRAGFDQHVEYLADGPLARDGLAQRQVPLDLIAVATTVLLLDDVARFSQLCDDSEGAALGDIQRGGDLAQAHAGVVRDAD